MPLVFETSELFSDTLPLEVPSAIATVDECVPVTVELTRVMFPEAVEIPLLLPPPFDTLPITELVNDTLPDDVDETAAMLPESVSPWRLMSPVPFWMSIACVLQVSMVKPFPHDRHCAGIVACRGPGARERKAGGDIDRDGPGRDERGTERGVVVRVDGTRLARGQQREREWRADEHGRGHERAE